ncbi:MAG TPA: TetR/AcrR family transcriptional regulator [Myxococcaceae bacterium]|nr:TetR/AcrR family transcriptional regulator [Myxococcaceae bacterium]
MNKGSSTRQAIVDEALRRATRVGLENVTIGVLAEALDLSKSGLFAHFKSKEALQKAVLNEAVVRFTAQVVQPALKAKAGCARLRKLMAGYFDWLEGRGDLPGCPFVTLAQEYDDRPGELRATLVTYQRDWRGLLMEMVRTAISGGELASDTDPHQLAFELVGIALAFQHSHKLLDDRAARRRAEIAVDKLLSKPR